MPNVLPSNAESLLQTVGRKEDRAIATAGTAVQKEIQKAVRNYAAHVQTILDETFADPKNRKPVLRDVLKVGEDLRAALLDAGLEDIADEFNARLQSMNAVATENFKALGARKSLAGIDIQSLDALAALKEAEFLDIFDKRLVLPVQNSIIQGVIGGRDRTDIYSEIQTEMDRLGIVTRADQPFTDTQLETLIDDGFRRQLRQAKAQQAEKYDMQVLWYQGPVDKVTSEQCEFMATYEEHGAPGMWLVEEFTADNINRLMGKDLLKENPLVVGGHFRCRHRVNYIPNGFAKEKGWTTPALPDDDEFISAED